MKQIINKTTRATAVLIAALAPLLSTGISHAVNPVTISLSPASGSYTVGASFNVSVLENSSTTSVAIVTASISYDPAKLQCTSTNPAGSGFNVEADNSCSGGTALLSRGKTGSPLTGQQTVSVLTFKVLAAGTGAVTVNAPCATTSQSGCSTVGLDGTSNFLTGVSGASFTLSAPATGGGGSSSGGGTTPTPTPTPTPTKTTTKTTTTTKPATTTTPATTTPTTTPTTPTTPTTTTPDTSTDTETAPADVTLTLLDQSGKPVANAKVTVNGVSGTTDKNGKVTLSGLDPGSATGSVTYKGQKQPITLNVKDGSVQPKQNTKLTIKVKKTSAVAPVALTIGTLIVVAAAAFVLAGPGKGLGALINKFRGGNKPSAPTAGPTPPVDPTPPTPPVEPKPVASIDIKEEAPVAPPAPKADEAKRLDPMAPGTTFSPQDPVPHTSAPA